MIDACHSPVCCVKRRVANGTQVTARRRFERGAPGVREARSRDRAAVIAARRLCSGDRGSQIRQQLVSRGVPVFQALRHEAVDQCLL